MSKPFNKKAFIINLLRRGTYRYPARNEALKKAKIGRNQYHCKFCGPDKVYGRKDVSVDHRYPVVDPVQGFTGWQDYVDRMFCDESGFDVLCHEHHDLKSAKENLLRRETKAAAKTTKKKVRRGKRKQ